MKMLVCALPLFLRFVMAAADGPNMTKTVANQSWWHRLMDQPKDLAMVGVKVMATSAPPAPTHLLWLPLGDSITWGCGTDAQPRGGAVCAADAGGYRVPLAWALSQQGHNVTTMGTLRTGPNYVTPQWLAHEGHPGWRFDQIDALLKKSMATSPTKPDLITIHLGTNDCGQGATVATINARLVSLLNHTYKMAPKAQVFIASMISFPGKAECADTFNKGLPVFVKEFAAKGMMIHYVPMQEWSGVCTAGGTEDPLSGLCCGGKVHPTAAGYLRMASAFALSIAEAKVFGELTTEMFQV